MNFGERLKEERERLGLSQPVLGSIGGVTKLSQLKYETGSVFPKANYLIEIAKVGVDVAYLLFGERAHTTINDEELLLLQKFRNADPAVRKFMLYGGEATSIGQNFEGDIHGSEFKVEMK